MAVKKDSIVSVDAAQVSLANAEEAAHDKGADMVALDDALNELVTFDERQSKIVELRFFGGLSLEETAEELKISPRRRAARMESGAGVALS